MSFQLRGSLLGILQIALPILIFTLVIPQANCQTLWRQAEKRKR